MAVVLVVEDEVFIRQNAVWTIEDIGHNTLIANDQAEALVHLRDAGPIDALFVDIRLGGQAHGGYAVADEAIRLRPDLRVLYTSGSALTGDMTDRFVPGGRFLQKPYSDSHLDAALADLFQPATP